MPTAATALDELTSDMTANAGRRCARAVANQGAVGIVPGLADIIGPGTIICS